ncbi:SURF1 family protein [Ancylobacter sp. TS-1]|uniref:SURF1 family protein n=1 Tax=Ancylobacter sp. TS-1 TaxID=1850374 RepID=UPI001265C3A1|nr:SURF1 family protein [Ancylobacter sp. TS-1]QFR31632.1 SURF1 family protein [Ancylobacter sp. TS-1]
MSEPSRSARRRLLPVALAALAAFGVLVGLGIWQLERLAWKESLIAQVEARIHEAPANLPDEAEWPRVSFAEDEYRRVTAQGRFRHDLEVQVYALIDAAPDGSGGPGYWVVTPLALADGAYVLVNRGFVPVDRRAPSTRPEGQVDGVVTVTGLLRMPEEAAMFTPPNDAAKDSWFVRDPEAVAAAKGILRVAPFLIDADATPNPGGLPRGGLTRISFPNRHLEYALTWFGLAGSLLAVFAALIWSRRRR